MLAVCSTYKTDETRVESATAEVKDAVLAMTYARFLAGKEQTHCEPAYSPLANSNSSTRHPPCLHTEASISRCTRNSTLRRCQNTFPSRSHTIPMGVKHQNSSTTRHPHAASTSPYYQAVSFGLGTRSRRLYQLAITFSSSSTSTARTS
jgi:hypothetical protein